MEKPIVFLSHSSKNKRELIALKQLLDRKAVGFIKFFLSSDGESIPLGTNWVQHLDEALKKTKLMFVFVSREALGSEWILFEAGYAYSRDIHVVPYCLPGTEIRHLPSPLKLLQANNLHCAKDFSTLLKKCNEIFDTKIPVKFTAQEFSTIFRQLESPEEKTKTNSWEVIVKDIQAEIEGPPKGADVFAKLCRRKHLDYFREHYGTAWTRVTSSGVTLNEQSEWLDLEKREHVKPPNQRLYTFTLSPQLFGLTAPIIDLWAKNLKLKYGFRIEVRFQYGVDLERQAHDFTTKLFDSEIQILGADWFGFRDVRFSLRRGNRWDDWTPLLKLRAKLSDSHFPEIVFALLQREVLLVDRDLAKRLKAKA